MAEDTEIQVRLRKNGFVKNDGSVAQERADLWFIDPPESSHPESQCKRHKIVYSKTGVSLEEPYYFILDHMRELREFMRVYKIKDIFTAAENSAMFGATAQRLSIQQDRAMQYFAQVGKFVKDLFQMVREIRIIEMRKKMYMDAKAGDKTADMALKGIWVDMVEGGTKNATSVLGLASVVGFTILPDLFFGTYVNKRQDVNKIIKELKFNEKVKEVLARKLYGYMVWREETEKEIETRFSFMIKYIRQHYEIIRTYMHWVRPYLTHVKRLSMNEKQLHGPEIVSAFESATIELEQMYVREIKGGQTGYLKEVFIITYNYRTRPGLDFQQDGYQHRGPQHQGRVEIDFRGYIWTEDQIKAYMKYREEEDIELLGAVDVSISKAMESLGDDFKRYLKMTGDEKFASDEKPPEAPKPEGIKPRDLVKTALSPVTNIVNGFSEMIIGKDLFTDERKPKSNKPSFTKHDKWQQESDKDLGKRNLEGDMWVLFHVFKKGHKMLTW